jgi:Family of unknown function (DUF5995)
VVGLVTALAIAAPAYADHHDEDLPWPQALPAAPSPNHPQPHGVKNCRRAGIRCIDGLMRRLDAQWRPLDAACDHRALFSLSYLRITAGLREDLARPDPLYFDYPDWFTYVITTFSNRYFEAFADYERGRPVPAAWKITFDEAARGDVNGGQDVLLASNAHTQHDLPYAYAEMGLRTPDGRSRKHDHDGVNAINTRVFDELEDEFAERYDPQFKLIDMKPVPLDEVGTMEMVKGWREGAWRNAERLVNARTPAERKAVEDSIEVNSRVWAEMIRSVQQPGYHQVRDQYCRSKH